MRIKTSPFGSAVLVFVSIAGVMAIRGAHAQTYQSSALSKSSQAAAPNTPSAPDKPYDWKSSFAKVPTGKVPRTLDGKPDLQGIWSFSILTPLERPNGEKATEISAGEVEEAEDAAQKAAINLRIESTITPPGEKTTDAYNSFWRDGYWYKVPMTTLHTSQVVDPPDGRIPPLTPAARQRRAEAAMRLNRPATGPEDRPTTSRCLTGLASGPPIHGAGPGSQETTLEIVQSRTVVVVHQEALHDSQMVYLDGRPRPSEAIHFNKGAARGHWEGDTLVVESTNFKAWANGSFSAYGTSERMRITERWKRLDDAHLLYGFTIDDPGTWTKPWSVEYVMWRLTNQEQIVEYACNEGNVGIEFTLSAARTKEKEEAEPKEKLASAAPPRVASATPKHGPVAVSPGPASSNALGMEFVQIPAGEFEMGCTEDAKATECDKDERPPHDVQITKAFEIGKTEVTQKQWQALMATNPSAHLGNVQLPVEQVSFKDVQQFLDILNSQNDGFLYRLPTEAEWEYAVRSGTTDQYADGLDNNGATVGMPGPGLGGFNARHRRESHPVETEKPNAWGIYEMRGNVKEWVEDWYSTNYFASSPESNPAGPSSGDSRVARGTSFRVYTFQTYPWLMRVSVRSFFPEDYQAYDVGFRVVRQKK